MRSSSQHTVSVNAAISNTRRKQTIIWIGNAPPWWSHWYPKQIQVEITLIHREIYYFSSKYYAFVHIRHLWKCLQPTSAIIFRKATAVTHLIPLHSGTNDPVYFQPCCSISWKQTSLWISVMSCSFWELMEYYRTTAEEFYASNYFVMLLHIDLNSFWSKILNFFNICTNMVSIL